MPATRRHMNWSGVTFTPAGGTLLTITGVTSVKINTGGTNEKFSGDGDQFPTTVVHSFNDPTVNVTCGDTQALLTIGSGTAGVLVCILNDARNGTGTGAITFTIAAISKDVDVNDNHKQFAAPTLAFDTVSPDGTTSPIAYAVAS